MISTTDVSTMWSDFQTQRAKTLSTLPPTIDPSSIPKQSSSSSSSSSSTGSVLGALDSDSDSSSGSAADSWVKKYGTVALGLLAANLIVGIVLICVTLTLCVRGMKGKSGARYAPVRFRTDADDYERGALDKYGD